MKVNCTHKSLDFTLYINDPDLRPRKGSTRSVGLDLPSPVDVTIPPGKHAMIPLYITWEVTRVKPGYVAYVAANPRSGNAKNYRVTLTNSPGIIDEDYLGGWWANVLNLGDEDFVIARGDYIVQAMFKLAPDIDGLNVFCDGRIRGTGGHGSTDALHS